MIDERNLLRKYNIKPVSYEIKNNSKVIIAKDNKYVIKKKKNSKENLFEYLASRSFLSFPRIYNKDDSDKYDIYEYIDEINTPKEQKAEDIISLITMLHSKTTHYKKLDIEDYKKIYEDLKNEISNTILYYQNINELIDEQIYMSPSNYLLVRNITRIYASLNYSNHELDEWYKLIKDKDKVRVVTLHNNLNLDHLIRNENNYLISWDNYKIDNPIYDLYKFYKNCYDDVGFLELLNLYESKYPLAEDERKLLFILISIPEKIEFISDEYQNTKKVNNIINYIYKTDKLISPYYSKE